MILVIIAVVFIKLLLAMSITAFPSMKSVLKNLFMLSTTTLEKDPTQVTQKEAMLVRIAMMLTLTHSP
jgi:hypothetical protein